MTNLIATAQDRIITHKDKGFNNLKINQTSEMSQKADRKILTNEYQIITHYATKKILKKQPILPQKQPVRAAK